MSRTSIDALQPETALNESVAHADTKTPESHDVTNAKDTLRGSIRHVLVNQNTPFPLAIDRAMQIELDKKIPERAAPGTDAERFPGETSETFTAMPEIVQLVTETTLRHVPRDRPVRMLDLGCGSGSHALELAKRLPLAQIVGLDISRSSIEAAREAAQRSPHGDRLSFYENDYMAKNFDKPFDVITACSVLHLIPAIDRDLVRKLSSDLAPEGTMIINMAYSCPSNTALWSVRRCFQAARSRLTDKFILWIARALHSKQMSDEMLQERVQYMYSVPSRAWDKNLSRLFREEGQCDVVEESIMPQASLGQARHKMLVMNRRA